MNYRSVNALYPHFYSLTMMLTVTYLSLERWSRQNMTLLTKFKYSCGATSAGMALQFLGNRF